MKNEFRRRQEWILKMWLLVVDQKLLEEKNDGNDGKKMRVAKRSLFKILIPVPNASEEWGNNVHSRKKKARQESIFVQNKQIILCKIENLMTRKFQLGTEKNDPGENNDHSTGIGNTHLITTGGANFWIRAAARYLNTFPEKE